MLYFFLFLVFRSSNVCISLTLHIFFILIFPRVYYHLFFSLLSFSVFTTLFCFSRHSLFLSLSVFTRLSLFASLNFLPQCLSSAPIILYPCLPCAIIISSYSSFSSHNCISSTLSFPPSLFQLSSLQLYILSILLPTSFPFVS